MSFIRERKIPTILGLLLLIGGSFLGVKLTTQTTSFNTNAATDCTPIAPIQARNLTHQSVDISFTTSGECNGYLNLSSQIYRDVRKQTSSLEDSKTKTHYFQITGLTPATKYTYDIYFAGKKYSTNTIFTTLSTPSGTQSSGRLAWGKVVDTQDKALPWIILYLDLPGTSPLSAFTSSEGNWSIPFSVALDSSTKTWLNQPSSGSEDFTLTNNSLENMTVSNTTNNNNPVPDIIFGQGLKTTNSSVNPIKTGQIGSQPTVAPNQVSLAITYPQNNETISSQTPELLGTGPANNNISLSLTGTSNQQATVTIDNLGKWHWSPLQKLSAGTYTLIVTQINNSATAQSQFTVDPGSSSLAFVGTPSALTATSTPIPTITPTLTPSPTPTTIVRTVQPTGPSMKNYTTGNDLPTTSLILFSALISTVGLYLLLHP